jgi:hypothetical protein
MIYTLTVILVLVGAAASAIVVIVMWDAGAPVLSRCDGENGQVKAVPFTEVDRK